MLPAHQSGFYNSSMAKQNTKRSSGHKKLKAIWIEKKKDLGLTQALAGEKMGFASHSTVGEYINGTIPLNLTAAIGFARILEVPLDSIWEGDPLSEFIHFSASEVEDLVLRTLSEDEQLALAARIIEHRRQT